MSSIPASAGPGGRRYLRHPIPLVFPSDEEVPEHKLHVELRTALYQLVRLALGDRVIVGTEQFVYYDAGDPARCLAPDLIACVGGPDEIFGTWKVWERGAPHVAVEIVSPSDKPPDPWQKKLEQYLQCGVREVVRFDPVAKSGRLRIWDRVEGDLVERDVSHQPVTCVTRSACIGACPSIRGSASCCVFRATAPAPSSCPRRKKRSARPKRACASSRPSWLASRGSDRGHGAGLHGNA